MKFLVLLNVSILVFVFVSLSQQQGTASFPRHYTAELWSQNQQEIEFQIIYSDLNNGLQRIDTVLYDQQAVQQQINLGKGYTYTIVSTFQDGITNCTQTASKPPQPLLGVDNFNFGGYTELNFQNCSIWFLSINFSYNFQYIETVLNHVPMQYQAGYISGPIEVMYDFVSFDPTQPHPDVFYMTPKLLKLCENGI